MINVRWKMTALWRGVADLTGSPSVGDLVGPDRQEPGNCADAVLDDPRFVGIG